MWLHCGTHAAQSIQHQPVGADMGGMAVVVMRGGHIVRRVSNDQVRLLRNQLCFVAPGELLAAERGERNWPHNVFQVYWPLAQADSFQSSDPRDSALAVREFAT